MGELLSYLIESENGFDALVHELGLLLEASPIQGHQFLVEVHTKEVKVVLEVNVLGFPQRDGADGAHCTGQGERAR